MMKNLKSLGYFFIFFICLIYNLFLECSKAQEKTFDLQIPDIIIRATTPDLVRGKKEPVPYGSIESNTDLVSSTVTRSPNAFPEVLTILNAPELQIEGSVKSPCLISLFGPFLKSKGKLQRAAVAYQNQQWAKAINYLMPIALDSPDSTDAPKALYFIGICKQNLNDLSGAANAFDLLRRKHPSDPTAEYASYWLGWIYLESKNLDRALEVITQFRDRYPNSPLTPYARYLEAATEYGYHQHQKALQSLQGIVDGYPLFPYMSRVQFWIAENMYFIGSIEQAMQNYTQYITNFDDDYHIPDALYGRAFCYMDLHNSDKALKDFETLINKFPDHPLTNDALFQAGKLLVLNNKNQSAIQYFNAVLQTKGLDFAREMEARGWIAFESKEYKRASELFNAAAKETVNQDYHDEMLFMSASALMQNKSYKESAKIFQTIANESGSSFSSVAWVNSGIAWMKWGDLNKAYECIQMGISDNALKNKGVFKLYASEILYRLARYEESLAMLNEIDTSEVSKELNSEIVRGKAWNYHALKQWKEATHLFGEYSEQYPESVYHAEALLRQAEGFFNLDDYPSAINTFDKVIKQYPLHPEAFEARLLKARIQWVQEEYDEAESILQDATMYANNGTYRQKARLLLGDLIREKGDYRRASSIYAMAYHDAPEDIGAPQSLLKQADCQYSLKNYESAEEIYRQLVELFPDSEEAITAQYSIGLTFLQRNRFDDYVGECFETAAQHPGSIQAALCLSGAAEILVEQKRYENAIRIFETLLSDFSDKIDRQQTQFRLGQTLMESGNTDVAISEFTKLYQNHPSGLYAADAALALAYHALDQDKEDVALQYFNSVIERFPMHPRLDEAMYFAANINFSQGHYETAEKLIQQLIESSSNSGFTFKAHLLLGDIYKQQKKFELAQEAYKYSSSASDRKVSVSAQLGLADCLASVGQKQEALSLYLKISYLYKDQQDSVFESLVKASEIQIENGNADDAHRLLQKALQLAATEEETQYVLKAMKEL
ncbi:tetratricopeptide repeat protein [bacterium]|nr:tetratricopeptide repeat protein [candidate division CSSED10-310 bacterium]